MAIYEQPRPSFKHGLEICTIYLKYEGFILLLHRHLGKSQGGKWSIPGGKVERGETPLQAIIREVHEEIGYSISLQEIEFLDTLYIEYSEEEHFAYHTFCAPFLQDPTLIKVDWKEHSGFTWTTPQIALTMNLVQDEDACIRRHLMKDR